MSSGKRTAGNTTMSAFKNIFGKPLSLSFIVYLEESGDRTKFRGYNERKVILMDKTQKAVITICVALGLIEADKALKVRKEIKEGLESGKLKSSLDYEK